MKVFSVFFCFFALAAALFAAPPVTSDSWTLTVQDGNLALALTLPANAHAYESSTGPILPDGVKPVSAPEPKQEIDALTEELESFYVGPGAMTWILPQTAATDGNLKVKWQVCVGDMCYAPGSAELAVPGAAPRTDSPEKSSSRPTTRRPLLTDACRTCSPTAADNMSSARAGSPGRPSRGMP